MFQSECAHMWQLDSKVIPGFYGSTIDKISVGVQYFLSYRLCIGLCFLSLREIKHKFSLEVKRIYFLLLHKKASALDDGWSQSASNNRYVLLRCVHSVPGPYSISYGTNPLQHIWIVFLWSVNNTPPRSKCCAYLSPVGTEPAPSICLRVFAKGPASPRSDCSE